MIVEKKFIKLPQNQDLTEEGTSYSTITYDREDTFLSQELHQLISKGPSHHINTVTQSSLLTYSHSCSETLLTEILPLVNRILHLLASKEHVRRHVEGSLAIKGYQSHQCVQIGKIVAVSFADYVGLSQSLSETIKKGGGLGLEEAIATLKGQLVSAKLQNAQQMKQIERLEEQNMELKTKLNNMTSEKKQDSMCGVLGQINAALTKMNLFQTEVYQRLGQQQQTLLELALLRNKLTLEESRVTNSAKRNRNNSTQSKQVKIDMLREELELQRSLYDQLLDRNIQLEKQLHFASTKQTSNSLTVVENNAVFGKDEFSL